MENRRETIDDLHAIVNHAIKERREKNSNCKLLHLNLNIAWSSKKHATK